MDSEDFIVFVVCSFSPSSAIFLVEEAFRQLAKRPESKMSKGQNFLIPLTIYFLAIPVWVKARTERRVIELNWPVGKQGEPIGHWLIRTWA